MVALSIISPQKYDIISYRTKKLSITFVKDKMGKLAQTPEFVH
jgi:hypothetical protein